MRLFLALLLFCGLAHAQEREYAGVAADVATTAIGIGSGVAAEANQLALVMLPARLAIINHADKLPDGERQQVLDTAHAINVFAVGNNLAVLAGIGGPAAPIIGLVAGYIAWTQGADRREFAQICARERAENPNLRCIWNNEVIGGIP